MFPNQFTFQTRLEIGEQKKDLTENCFVTNRSLRILTVYNLFNYVETNLGFLNKFSSHVSKSVCVSNSPGDRRAKKRTKNCSVTSRSLRIFTVYNLFLQFITMLKQTLGFLNSIKKNNHGFNIKNFN